MAKLGHVTLAVALTGLAIATKGAMAQEPFYKGKRLTVLNNFVPGGGADIAARLNLANQPYNHVVIAARSAACPAGTNNRGA